MVVVGLNVSKGEDGRPTVLIQKRPDHMQCGGLWEFPGGKVDPGETMKAALAREWKEELDLEIEVGDLIDEQVVSFPDGEALLPLFEVTITPGQTPRALLGQEFAYMSIDEAMKLPGTPTMPLYQPAVRRRLLNRYHY